MTDSPGATLPTVFQQYIAQSKYCRWIQEEGRREIWPEPVQRYVDHVIRPVLTAAGVPEKETNDLAQRAFNAISKVEVLPSMRALMTAGPALDRDNMAGYNPVSAETLVVTKEYGNVPISEVEGKALTVLNKDGRWSKATFTGYGNQAVKKVTLRLNSNTVKSVRATANHRWVLVDGTVVSTEALRTGDKIPFASAPKADIDTDYLLGVRHGIVYSDGTAQKSCGRVKGYNLRLCGDSKELITYFAEYPCSYPPSANGDPVVFMYDGFSATHSLKCLPESETDSYVLGFIRGWFAGDGSVGTDGRASICCHEDGLQWLLKNAERAGFVVQSYDKLPRSTNYGERKRDTYRVSFCRSSMSADDMLCSWKREKFKPLESHFVVHSVEDDGTADVYCAEVPDTNTFVLSGGLVTGNCSFLAVDSPRAFDEALYILSCGTGLGFSVERQFIANLPVVAEEFNDTDTVVKVKDSKIGWATALKETVSMLYAGQVPKFDVSAVRAAGERLKVFGGRASGPGPLVDLLNYFVRVFRGAAGRRLSSIECHGLMCKIGEAIVVGGVRRSALISLSNLTDQRMRNAKSGQWFESTPEFSLANNSVAFTEKPDTGAFFEEWLALYRSKSGERGIFNRDGVKKKMKRLGRRDPNHEWGTNPCSEISLRPMQLCNLSEVVLRAEDTRETLREKVELAAILGTIQSTFTNFRYVRAGWRKNVEEERLLGVSFTGVYDNPAASDADLLDELRDLAVSTNKAWAEKLGIPASAAVTCNKPSGTTSALADTASGIHPRHSKFYLRSVRQDNKDPLTKLLLDSGVPAEPCAMRPESTTVFYFPMKAPDGAITKDDVTATSHLEMWRLWNTHWAEHQVSVTVSVRESEWMKVGAWVYENFDDITGISFLPFDGGSYKQAPFQAITEDEYHAAVAKTPTTIDWTLLSNYEKEDATTGSQELACVGGVCEIL